MGGILLSNQHWDSIAERVIADDFYTFQHRLIFTEMEHLMRNQSPIDLITLDQALRSRGVSDEVGGLPILQSFPIIPRTQLIFWLMRIL